MDLLLPNDFAENGLTVISHAYFDSSMARVDAVMPERLSPYCILLPSLIVESCLGCSAVVDCV